MYGDDYTLSITMHTYCMSPGALSTKQMLNGEFTCLFAHVP